MNEFTRGDLVYLKFRGIAGCVITVFKRNNMVLVLIVKSPEGSPIKKGEEILERVENLDHFDFEKWRG